MDLDKKKCLGSFEFRQQFVQVYFSVALLLEAKSGAARGMGELEKEPWCAAGEGAVGWQLGPLLIRECAVARMKGHETVALELKQN